MIDTLALAPVRVRHEAIRRPVKVVSAEPIGTSFIQVTFGGEALAGFTSLSFDDHCKFIFHDSDGGEQKRDFTPRSFDEQRKQLTLEFALHDGGAATEWVRQVNIGDEAVIGGPKSSVVIPTGYAWHVLAGDVTATPAIARRLEELPIGSHAFAVLLDTEANVGRELACKGELNAVWTHDEQAFLAALRGLELPQGQGFVWCAGEAGLMAQVREIFVNQRAHPRTAMRIAGYWKRNEAGFHGALESGLN